MSARALGLCVLVYTPHLIEEYLTRMYDDPLIVFAFGALADMPARQSAYLVFQVMMIVTLFTAYAFSLGGRWRDAVMTVLAIALLCEAHHVVRALATLEYNSGALTSLPMPILGALVLGAIVRRQLGASAGAHARPAHATAR